MKKNNKKVYESKIYGLKIKVYKNKVKILNSYQIKKIPKMEIILDKLAEKHCVWLSKRPIESFTSQWVFYNRLYKIHLFRKKTKSIIFKEKISVFKKIFYFIFGYSKNR